MLAWTLRIGSTPTRAASAPAITTPTAWSAPAPVSNAANTRPRWDGGVIAWINDCRPTDVATAGTPTIMNSTTYTATASVTAERFHVSSEMSPNATNPTPTRMRLL